MTETIRNLPSREAEMKRLIAFAVLLTTVSSAAALADGMFVPTQRNWKQYRERALINEPEQKAVIFFSRGKEQLIISPSYEGSASSFAWVVPVPARPKVEILKGAIFHELAELTMPVEDLALGGRAMKAAANVTVLERKTVGAYDVSVLAATDGKALMKWLAANQYYLPAKAIGPMKAYVKERWTFVACRVKIPANAKGLRTGTLAPLRLTFPTKRPVYPMRLSSANSQPFTIQLYVILPKSETGGRIDTITFTSKPSAHGNSNSTPVKRVGRNQDDYPTLAKLSNEELQVFHFAAYCNPDLCDKDYMWNVPVHVGWWPW
jgi:hypothetical protein